MWGRKAKNKIIKNNELNRLHFYQAIQSQTKPHFVTNTFNEVIAMAEDDSYTAEQKLENIKKFAISLSEYYGFLTYSEDSMISIKKEIELVQKYAEIEKVANPELTVNIKYNEEEIKQMEHMLIPPLIIQPLVNNAVKYSNITNMDKGKIDVIIKKKGEGCLIVVEDNGDGFVNNTDDGRQHTGIENIYQRVKSCNGTLRVINKTDNGGSGTRCEIELFGKNINQ